MLFGRKNENDSGETYYEREQREVQKQIMAEHDKHVVEQERSMGYHNTNQAADTGRPTYIANGSQEILGGEKVLSGENNLHTPKAPLKNIDKKQMLLELLSTLENTGKKKGPAYTQNEEIGTKKTKELTPKAKGVMAIVLFFMFSEIIFAILSTVVGIITAFFGIFI